MLHVGTDCKDCPKLEACDRFKVILGLNRATVALPDPKHSPLEKTAYLGMVN